MSVVPDFVAVVPARLGATRLPDKPTADIGGAPMIARVLAQAAQSSAGKVVAAVDGSALAQVVGAAGYEAVVTGDADSGTARVAQAAVALGLRDDAIVVNVQGDEPFIEPAVIDAAAAALAAAANADCVCATVARRCADAAEFADAAAVKVVCDAGGRALYFSRAPIPYSADFARALIHIGVYAYRVGFLQRLPTLPAAPAEQSERLEQLRILHCGERIVVAVVESESFGVDTPADLEKARRRFAGG